MISTDRQKEIMKQVLDEVKKAIELGDNPYACILTDRDGKVVTRTHNTQNSTNDRTAHAEVNLVKKACKLLNQRYHLQGYSVFSNSEPCSMCMSLLVKTKIDAVYFGVQLDKENDPYITSQEIVDKSQHKIKVIGNILKNEGLDIKSSMLKDKKFK